MKKDYEDWMNKNISCPSISSDDFNKLVDKMLECYRQGYKDGFQDHGRGGIGVIGGHNDI